MVQYSHKGQILPLVNQMIPIDKQTTFHASYDYHLNGMNQGDIAYPLGASNVLSFNGTNAFIDCGNSTIFNSANITFEAWVNPNKYANYLEIISKEAQYKYRIDANGNIGVLISLTGTTWDSVNTWTNVTVPLNTWSHVALVINSSANTIEVFVNGISYGTKTLGGSITAYNTRPVNIASFNSSGGELFSGLISQTRIWNTARTQQQIQTNMYNENPEPTNLVGYWKLKETEGSKSYDSSGNGTDGIWRGTITSTYGPTVASIKKNQGKFGGAVLIEPDTTNIALNTDYSNHTYYTTTDIGGWGGDDATVTYYPGGGYNNLPYKKMTKITGGTGGSFVDEHGNFSITDGTTYTISCYMKASVPVTVDGYALSINRSSDNAYRLGGNINLTTDWVRVSWVYTAATGDAGSYVNRSIIYLDNNLPIDIYWCGFQIEARSTPTSYTKTSRPLGKLWYPKELINLSAFTIGCWFNIPYMHTTSPNNTGIQGSWYHPIIELAPSINTTGWDGIGIVAGPQPSSWNRKAGLYIGSSFTQTNGTAIQDNTWYHAVLTYDGTTLKLYINGVMTDSIAHAPYSPGTNHILMVGGGYMGKAFCLIDELRIESRAISIDEVSAWAASGLHYNYLDYSQYVD